MGRKLFRKSFLLIFILSGLRTALGDEIITSGLKIMDELSERNTRRRKYHVSFFAEYLADTLDIFYALFPDKPDIIELALEEEETKTA